jgi:hypothetical protein
MEALDADWAALCEHAEGRAALRRWAAECPPLAELTELEQLRELVHGSRDLDLVDTVLGWLLRLAAVSGGDDQTACRVLLKLLAPGLGKLARTLSWLPDEPSERQGAVLGTATELIRTCTWWPRRHRAIAKNLLMDTHMLLRRAHRRPALSELPVGLPTDECGLDLSTGEVAGGGGIEHVLDEVSPDLWETDAGDARLELLHLLAWARRTGVLSQTEIRLLVDLDLNGVAEEQLGRRLNIAAGSVRRSRNRALARLRCAAGEQAAASLPAWAPAA